MTPSGIRLAFQVYPWCMSQWGYVPDPTHLDRQGERGGEQDRLREHGELLDQLDRDKTPSAPSGRRVWVSGLILLAVFVVAVAVFVL